MKRSGQGPHSSRRGAPFIGGRRLRRPKEPRDPARLVVVPAVAFLERARQLTRQGRMDPAEYRTLLERRGWLIESFGANHAVRSPAHGLGDGLWKRLARDAMIASHVCSGDDLWTANPRDFLEVGVAAAQVIDVGAAYP